MRQEAKVALCRMFGIWEGYSSGTVEKIVDCIIGAAMLEIAVAQSEAIAAPLPPQGDGRKE